MASKFQRFDLRSLATIQATPGLRCPARDPALVPYLYHWCRPTLTALLKTHGFDLFDQEFAPPHGDRIFTPATIDHKIDTAVTALSRPEDTSARRSPHDRQAPPQLRHNSTMLAALAAAATASPPVKRKRDHAASPPHVSFAQSGTSHANPFSLDDDTLASPDVMPQRHLVFPAHGPASRTQRSSEDRYDPAKSVDPLPVVQVARYWSSCYNDRLASQAPSSTPDDDPFLHQLLRGPPAEPPAPLTDFRRQGGGLRLSSTPRLSPRHYH